MDARTASLKNRYRLVGGVFLVVFLALLTALTTPGGRAYTDAPDFSTLSRKAFIREYEAFAQFTHAGTRPLYARLDPALPDKLPDGRWTREDRSIAGCIYDDLAENDVLDAADTFAAQGVDAMATIAADETITILTIRQNPDAIPGLKPPEAIAMAQFSCGATFRATQRMVDAGAYDAIMDAIMASIRKDYSSLP